MSSVQNLGTTPTPHFSLSLCSSHATAIPVSERDPMESLGTWDPPHPFPWSCTRAWGREIG